MAPSRVFQFNQSRLVKDFEDYHKEKERQEELLRTIPSVRFIARLVRVTFFASWY